MDDLAIYLADIHLYTIAYNIIWKVAVLNKRPAELTRSFATVWSRLLSCE
jgi:hypothetical protein